MDSKQELIKLQAEFKNCQKILTALGDETRQHLFSIMMMEKCSGSRVIDIAKKQICQDQQYLIICKY